MNWIDKEVAFYDFMWAYGVNACTDCINQELYEDFAAGGDKFEEMKKEILKKFPTREIALKEFEAESATPPDPQHGRDYCKLCSHPEFRMHIGCDECPQREPKPLAQYLDEYIEHEEQYNGISQDVGALRAHNSRRELFQQALDAYESTEQVKIRIERV